MRKFVWLIALVALTSPAFAIPPVVIVDPTDQSHQAGVDASGNLKTTTSATVGVAGVTTTNLSSTVAVTNTFQSIQVSTAGRKGCTVQNTSGNGDKMWVFFGAIGSATKAISIVLTDGQSLNCAVGGLAVATDQVSITGTATDTFAANFQ